MRNDATRLNSELRLRRTFLRNRWEHFLIWVLSNWLWKSCGILREILRTIIDFFAGSPGFICCEIFKQSLKNFQEIFLENLLKLTRIFRKNLKGKVGNTIGELSEEFVGSFLAWWSWRQCLLQSLFEKPSVIPENPELKTINEQLDDTLN